jgi:sulfoxide reductase heme-binding subunit YedZ
VSLERRTGIVVAGAVIVALAVALMVAGATSMPRITGWWALGLVVLALAATPARRVLGARGRADAAVVVHRARRSVGLGAAALASYHLLEALEHHFGAAMLTDVLDAVLALPWLRHGALAIALLWLLALTSLRVLTRRLVAWTALHRLVYPAALLAALHGTFAPHAGAAAIVAGGVVGLLLLTRLWPPRATESRPNGTAAEGTER